MLVFPSSKSQEADAMVLEEFALKLIRSSTHVVVADSIEHCANASVPVKNSKTNSKHVGQQKLNRFLNLVNAPD